MSLEGQNLSGISKEWLVRLALNEKEVHRLDTGSTIRPWCLTSPMTLILDFLLWQFWNNCISGICWSDWCEVDIICRSDNNLSQNNHQNFSNDFVYWIRIFIYFQAKCLGKHNRFLQTKAKCGTVLREQTTEGPWFTTNPLIYFSIWWYFSSITPVVCIQTHLSKTSDLIKLLP